MERASNDIRIKAGTNAVKNKIRLVSLTEIGFVETAACFFVVLIDF